MKLSGIERICFSGLLALIVFIFQLSPLLLPLLGTLLSPAVTLLVACSVILLRKQGILVYIGAAFMLLCVSPRIAAEFLLATGLSGLILGLSFWIKPVFTFLISSFTLLAGISCLTYLAGTAALNSLFRDAPILITIPFFAVFSMLYTGVWLYLLRRITKHPVFRLRLQN